MGRLATGVLPGDGHAEIGDRFHGLSNALCPPPAQTKSPRPSPNAIQNLNA